MKINHVLKRALGCVFMTAASLGLVSVTYAQDSAVKDYPSKPINLVVPYTPGGGADTLARIVAKGLSERVGQPVVVVNKPGANTIIGTEYVAEQKADGYTLLYAASSHAINPSLYKLKYDTEKAFDPISLVAIVPLYLVTNKQFPPNNIKELISYVKAHPTNITFASYGAGSPSHLAGELFKDLTGVSMLHIPYKGSTPSLADVMAGHVTMSFGSMPPALALVRGDKLKGLAVTTTRRVQSDSSVPTVAESGVAGFEAVGWNGILAPAGTPPAIVEKLNNNINAIINDGEVKKHLIEQGYEPETLTAGAFRQMISAEIKKWDQLTKKVGVTIK